MACGIISIHDYSTKSEWEPSMWVSEAGKQSVRGKFKIITFMTPLLRHCAWILLRDICTNVTDMPAVRCPWWETQCTCFVYLNQTSVCCHHGPKKFTNVRNKKRKWLSHSAIVDINCTLTIYVWLWADVTLFTVSVFSDGLMWYVMLPVWWQAKSGRLAFYHNLRKSSPR